MLVKVIVDGGVVPEADLAAAGRRLATARSAGAARVDMRVLPGFPASQQERPLTGEEFNVVVAAAAAALV